jgi:hypothetical protein
MAFFACRGSDRGGDGSSGDAIVLSVLFLSRRAQPCQYEDVRREQDERLSDPRGADLRRARGIANKDPDRQAGSLECATMTNAASRTKKRGAQKRCRARYKLISAQDIDLRVHLERWRPSLQLAHPGQLPDGREVAPGGALQDPRLLEEVGRRASLSV